MVKCVSESGSDKKNLSTLSFDELWNRPLTCNSFKLLCLPNHSQTSSVISNDWKKLVSAWQRNLKCEKRNINVQRFQLGFQLAHEMVVAPRSMSLLAQGGGSRNKAHKL